MAIDRHYAAHPGDRGAYVVIFKFYDDEELADELLAFYFASLPPQAWAQPRETNPKGLDYTVVTWFSNLASCIRPSNGTYRRRSLGPMELKYVSPLPTIVSAPRGKAAPASASKRSARRLPRRQAEGFTITAEFTESKPPRAAMRWTGARS